MSFTVPTFEPDKITAGDTASWKRSFADFPAGDGWTLSYALVKRGAGNSDPITFSATASGNDHLVNVTPDLTVQWPVGDYSGQGYVTKAAERHLVWTGLITILPNFAAGGAGDIRSHARKVLDAISSVLEKRASQEVLEWTVEGTQLRKATVTDLLMLRDRYLVIVQKEEAQAKIEAGRGTGRRILTRFTKPI